MRRFSDDEYDDLQIVLRAFCNENGVKLNQFANAVAERHNNGTSNGADRSPNETIDKFLKSSQNNGMHILVEDCLAELQRQVDEHSAIDGDKFHQFIRAFEKDADYRRESDVIAFLTDRSAILSTERKKRALNRRTNDMPALNKRIARVYHLAAQSFDQHDHDINFFDRRIGDSRFAFVRASSRRPNDFVVHGFRFAPHHKDQEIYYFSDKHVIRSDGEERVGRYAQGICLIENRYLSIMSRSASADAPFTYLHGKLPRFESIDEQQPLQRFRAVLSTINSEGVRFWASGLAFRCESKEDRRNKVGIYQFDELKERFSKEEWDELVKWRINNRFTVMKM